MDENGNGMWYDHSRAFKTPMDCYIATDRLLQIRHSEVD